MSDRIELDLESEMEKRGIADRDLIQMTGNSRQSVWRWRTTGQVPIYVATIIRLLPLKA